jgi:hypothetical protein
MKVRSCKGGEEREQREKKKGKKEMGGISK